MKFEFINKDIIVYIPRDIINFNLLIKEEIERFVKDIILRLKKKHNKKISGFYKVEVYQNDTYGLIFDIKKQNDLDLFPDLIDLKLIILYESEMFLELDDYFLLDKYSKVYEYNKKYYIDISLLEEKEILRLLEFSKIIYGEKKKQLENFLILLRNMI